MNRRSNENGIAMIIALFMVLALSVLGSSLMFISQSETWSSSNYRITSQARYAAESGVHHAANFLLNTGTYTPPSTSSATDPLTGYTTTATPVLSSGNNQAVVLSSDTTKWPSNYPYATAQTNFANTVKNENISLSGSKATYHASAKLLSMQAYTDAYSGQPSTIQTWEITSVGTVEGARNSSVEVSAVVEQQLVPLYRYAAFATANGCAALSFAGGATTDSYDSSVGPTNIAGTFQNSGGNVGTNGNLTEVGNPTQVAGTLSTPRSGVGACTANNVTALTVANNPDFHVTGGLVELSQSVQYQTPTLAATPPQISTTFAGNGTSSACPTGVSGGATCTNAGGVWTITPASPSTPVIMGDVRLNAGATLRMNPGLYVINSILQNGNSSIAVLGGTPCVSNCTVTVQVAGQNQSTPIDLTGGGISNPTMDPSRFQIIYPGTGTVRLNGGASAAALIYAPNATSNFNGNADFYGAVITNVLSATGGINIHYDRHLQRAATTSSNPMMSSFTWKTY